MHDFKQYGPVFETLAVEYQQLMRAAPKAEFEYAQDDFIDMLFDLAEKFRDGNPVWILSFVIQKLNAFGYIPKHDENGEYIEAKLRRVFDSIFQSAHHLVASHFDEEGDYFPTDRVINDLKETLARINETYTEFAIKG